MFWKKNGLKSEDFEIILKKIAEISYKTDENLTKIRLLDTEISNIRGLINKKFSQKKEEKTEEEEQSLKSQVILPHKW